MWCWLVSLTISNGARILAIFPFPAKSHFSCDEAMIRSLYDAGHEITFVSPFFNDESLKNYSAVNTRHNLPIYIGISSISEFRDLSFFESISQGIETVTQACKDVLGSSEIQVSSVLCLEFRLHLGKRIYIFILSTSSPCPVCHTL